MKLIKFKSKQIHIIQVKLSPLQSLPSGRLSSSCKRNWHWNHTESCEQFQSQVYMSFYGSKWLRWILHKKVPDTLLLSFVGLEKGNLHTLATLEGRLLIIKWAFASTEATVWPKCQSCYEWSCTDYFYSGKDELSQEHPPTLSWSLDQGWEVSQCVN